MKAIIASLFAASAVLAGMPAQAADVNNDRIVIAALSQNVDVVYDEEKKTDEGKKADDEEKKTDDGKKADDEEKKPDGEKKSD